MNPIIKKILKNRNGHYCHALEVEHVEELKCSIESLYEQEVETGEFTKADLVDFFETMDLYCLNDEHEDEVFAFNIQDFINGL